jgi:hypothetical protein
MDTRMRKNFINILTFLSFLFVRIKSNWLIISFMINVSLPVRFTLAHGGYIGVKENLEPSSAALN